jgi:hypothetical protein
VVVVVVVAGRLANPMPCDGDMGVALRVVIRRVVGGSEHVSDVSLTSSIGWAFSKSTIVVRRFLLLDERIDRRLENLRFEVLRCNGDMVEQEEAEVVVLLLLLASNFQITTSER